MRTKAAVSLLAIAFALPACVAAREVAYDREFAQLDAARSAARDRTDSVAREAAEAGLKKLADEARAAAGEARKNGRLPDAIALFRVAASGAWKSHRGNTISIAREGLDTCRELARKGAPPPRDCMFLELVQPLAVIEQRVDQILSFEQRIHAVRALPPDQRRIRADEAKSWADEVIEYTRQLDAIRIRIEGPEYARQLAPEMLQYVDRQIHLGFCRGGVKAALVFDNPELRDYAEKLKAELARGSLRQNIAKRLGRAPTNFEICKEM